MRQICRWYNIDVVYEGNLPPEKYFGEISRNSSLTEVFRILELNNLKFNVEGKTVKVSYDK
jgi:transmembrane sensor